MKPITELWLEGCSPIEIAIIHNATVQYVESVIRETWGGL